MGLPVQARPSDRWTITEQGKLDLEQLPTCHCDPKLAGLLFMCPECGTVFGSIRDSTVTSSSYGRAWR